MSQNPVTNPHDAASGPYDTRSNNLNTEPIPPYVFTQHVHGFVTKQREASNHLFNSLAKKQNNFMENVRETFTAMGSWMDKADASLNSFYDDVMNSVLEAIKASRNDIETTHLRLLEKDLEGFREKFRKRVNDDTTLRHDDNAPLENTAPNSDIDCRSVTRSPTPVPGNMPNPASPDSVHSEDSTNSGLSVVSSDHYPSLNDGINHSQEVDGNLGTIESASSGISIRNDDTMDIATTSSHVNTTGSDLLGKRRRGSSIFSASTLTNLEDLDDPYSQQQAAASKNTGSRKRQKTDQKQVIQPVTTRRKKTHPTSSKASLRKPSKPQEDLSIWPPRSMRRNAKGSDFIQCDKCPSWYHWGCVGIRGENDRRLENDEPFSCPPCATNSRSAFTGPTSLPTADASRTIIKVQECCSRPNCYFRDHTNDEYFVERFIGRYGRELRGADRYFWLIKWEGYPVTECKWLPGNKLLNPAKYIEDFRLAATGEGVMNGNGLVLLKEAKDAGFDKPSSRPAA